MKLTRRGRILATIGWSLLGAMLLAAGSYATLVNLAPVPSTQPQITTLTPIVAEAADITFPNSGSGAVTILGVPNSTFRYGNEHSLAIASITKLITALVVLDKHPLALGESGPTIQLSRADVDLYWQHVARNGSVTPVSPGWRFTQRQMLEIVLIPSSNNYADTLAIWAFGSTQNYLSAAQQWLATQGLSDTTVVDANGLNQQNRSSSVDLLRLGELVLANPVLAEIVGTQRISMPHLGPLENTNLLLHSVDSVLGIKTGTTSVAGACLLWAVEIEAVGERYTMIGVSLGGVNQRALAPQVQTLFESASDDFHELQLITSGTSLIRYDTLWGESIEAVVSEDLSTTSYGSAEVLGVIDAQPVALVEAGATLGTVTFEHEGVVHSSSLISTGSITGPDFWWRLLNPDKLW